MSRLSSSFQFCAQGLLGSLLLSPWGWTASQQQSTARIDVLAAQALGGEAPEHPNLGWAGSPEPGGGFELILRDVGALGFLAWSGDPAPTPLSVFGGLFHLGAAFQGELVFPDAGGMAGGLLAVDPVPSSLIGLDAVAQAASLDFSYPGLWRLSDALQVRFGWTPPLATTRPTGSLGLSQAGGPTTPVSSRGGPVDFSGDGITDLVLAGPGGPVALRHDVRGELQAELLPGASFFATGGFHAAGDFDGDGREEALVTYSLQVGATTFGVATRSLGEEPSTGDLIAEQEFSGIIIGTLALAEDLDQDGFDDFVQLDVANARLVLRFGSATGLAATVSTVPLAPGGTTGSEGLTAGDIDGDGQPELVALLGGELQAWSAGGAAPGLVSMGSLPSAIGLEVAQLDGDGVADIVVLENTANGSQVLARLSTTVSGSFSVLYSTTETLVDVDAQHTGSGAPDALALLPAQPTQETIELRFDGQTQLISDQRFERGTDLRLGFAAQVDDDAAEEYVVMDGAGYLSICESAEPIDESQWDGALEVWTLDVTGDDIEDTVAVFAGDLTVQVTDGATGNLQISALSGEFAEVQVATHGDFDGDGRVDVLLGAKQASFSNLRLFIGFGDGLGNFQVQPGLESGPAPVLGSSLEWVALELGDFDGDGRQELAHAWASPFAAEVRLQSIEFAEYLNGASSTVPTGPYALQASYNPEDLVGVHLRRGDLNGDGIADLVWNLESGEALLGSSVGWIPVSVAASTGGTSLSEFRGLALADLDQDGRDELVAERGALLVRFDFETSPLGYVETQLGGELLGERLTLSDANGDGILDVLSGVGDYVEVRPGGLLDSGGLPRTRFIYTGVPATRIFAAPQAGGPDLLRIAGGAPAQVRTLPNL